MGKSVPDAPDYTAAAQQTANSNRASTNSQTWANRPDQITPFGNMSWSNQSQFDQAAYDRAMQDWEASGANLSDKDRASSEYLALRPSQNDYYNTKWTQTTELDPQMQAALDDQQRIQSQRSDLAGSLFGRVSDEYANPMDWSQFGNMEGRNEINALRGNLPQLNSSDRYYDEAGDAIYGQWSNRQEPLMQRQADQLDTRLRNQGLKPGDEAYDNAISDLRNSQNDARRMASFGATAGAGAEASRMLGMDTATRGNLFGEGITSANFGNTVQQQQIAQEMQKRGFSLNEINAILSGQQIGMPNMPGFNAAGNSGGTNYSGAAGQQYQSSLDAFNAQQAGLQGLMSGITGGISAIKPFGF